MHDSARRARTRQCGVPKAPTSDSLRTRPYQDSPKLPEPRLAHGSRFSCCVGGPRPMTTHSNFRAVPPPGRHRSRTARRLRGRRRAAPAHTPTGRETDGSPGRARLGPVGPSIASMRAPPDSPELLPPRSPRSSVRWWRCRPGRPPDHSGRERRPHCRARQESKVLRPVWGGRDAVTRVGLDAPDVPSGERRNRRFYELPTTRRPLVSPATGPAARTDVKGTPRALTRASADRRRGTGRPPTADTRRPT
jgi:hypothetical protein